ncbi:bifunctional 3-(3-hydroxy-phenyl)propionate/3-hydroxycinnamic acid hydroxylase [Streptomyces beigongshangae]|uniref:bifunctional 3-(3-hydroxy-phenyl)propionate/3-hydroxycinnamic acid hydroxylase n=1 Tax=Streptomyces beigongshangae TaxID=2841597 RepID=UPI0027E101D1|nr:bifunctional 3-(3-hydroxy-phenyl)propionate/3-hydroxycinnamic acid hydroxylase [Streptomyces sp. REN17]
MTGHRRGHPASGTGERDAVYDVAVIGYGPTGATAANLLGARGLRVVVLERDAEVCPRARAISTDEEVMRIWQRAGLAERLEQDMLADRPVDFVDAQGRTFLHAHPVSHGHGHPAQLFLYQPAVERVLRAGAARYPNVTVLARHECLRVRQDAEGVDLLVATTDTAIAAGAAGTPGAAGTADTTAAAGTAGAADAVGAPVRWLRASYVIAADGGSSRTRTQLGVGYEGRTYEDRWVVVDTEMTRPWPDHDRLRFRCDPARPAVDCPTPLGHHRWEFPVLPGDDVSRLTTEEAILGLVARYGVGPDSIRILRAAVYSHHVRSAARFRVGRVLLAGDAAHAMPPWIGQGMAAGVRDVGNLCWKLDAVLRGELPESVLDSYEAERAPHVREVTRRSVFVGRIVTERRRPLTRLRDTVLPLLSRVPGFTRWLRDSHWTPAAHYATGLRAHPRPRPWIRPRTRPLARSRIRATGHQIPQPRVTAPDGTRVRLDEVLGGGWLLLHARTATPQPRWDVPSLTVVPAGSRPAAGTVVDTDGVLLPWFAAHRAATVALRPDAYVYAAARAGAVLPPPPPGFAPAARRNAPGREGRES